MSTRPIQKGLLKSFASSSMNLDINAHNPENRLFSIVVSLQK